MSKNTANRTFYYRDSTQGTFTINVGAKGRDTGEEWSANQQITISFDASQNSDSSPSEETPTSSSGSSSSLVSQSSGLSATNVSSPNSKLEVLAGSDRVTSPGSPIWFQATIKKNASSADPELNWSFGDGNVGVGSLVNHVYKYPGDFVVVLSARVGDMFSVSRLKVKVIKSSISVSDKGEYLEISNNGNTEINLFNWKLESEGKGFVFQPNTIILLHSSVKFDKSLLKMKGYDNSLGISLKNCMGEEVFSIAPVKKVDLNEASKNLEAIKNEVSVIQEKAKNMGLTLPSNNFNAQSTDILSVVFSDKKENSANSTQESTTTENVIYEAPKQDSFFGQIWNYIAQIFN
jgi:hypothetical protein